jgi:UTP-glucose-1-phosphate uridylyltransferase
VGSGREIQLADAINTHAKQGSVETVHLNGRRFDCGSVKGFMEASAHQFGLRGFALGENSLPNSTDESR